MKSDKLDATTGMVHVKLVTTPEGSQITNQFIHEEISMLFCSEKFHGGWVVVGDIAIITSSSRSRSLRDLR